jgi:hypothetical protein
VRSTDVAVFAKNVGEGGKGSTGRNRVKPPMELIEGYARSSALGVGGIADDRIIARIRPLLARQGRCEGDHESGDGEAASVGVTVHSFLTPATPDRVADLAGLTRGPHSHPVQITSCGSDLPRLFQPVITEDFRIAANSFGVR